MVMEPPRVRQERQKLRLELAWLNLKEKMFGKLSAEDQKRRRKIMASLAIKF